MFLTLLTTWIYSKYKYKCCVIFDTYMNGIVQIHMSILNFIIDLKCLFLLNTTIL